MTSSKRPRSPGEEANDRPDKAAKSTRAQVDAEDSHNAAARISELEGQVNDLHKFLWAQGLARKAPPNIRRLILGHPKAASKLASEIKAAAFDVYSPLEAETWNAKRTGVTSDDLSTVVMPFLREAEELLEDIQAPETVGIVFDLVKTLADYSFGEMDNKGCGYGDRPSDPVVDGLLEKCARQRLEIDPAWDCSSVRADLKKTAQFLSEYGIDDFCSQTIRLLSAWKVDDRTPSPIRASKKGNEKRP